MKISEPRGRAVRERDDETANWDAVVARLIGPTVTPADALAAAVVRAVGVKRLK